ncbi:hypothetical protein DPMN_004552 [Dreissena polymorpha]|uniref:Uncharacterized protein n=1 Tax=Dreissena polymorpha TaxID=45954 RepID=A0A9D4RVS0_DREPO|nr:hypothetical protein DPMN_004552 [Dreissena polymorpha]
MIEFEGVCLNLCPEWHRYSFTNTCLKDVYVIIALVSILAILVFFCSYFREVVADYVRVWSLMAIWNPDVTDTFLIILKELQHFELEMIDDDAAVFDDPDAVCEEETLL